MINGVLVERTVQDVLPQLQTNADGLKKVLDDLLKQYRSKQDEMEKWKVRVPEQSALARREQRDLQRLADTLPEEEQDPSRPAIA